MIADILDGSGSVTGVDISEPRLATTRTLVEKYKCKNIILILGSGTTFAAPPSPPITFMNKRELYEATQHHSA